MKLYEKLAADLEAAILSGALPVGSKLPSVRDTSRQRDISASTVFQAYYQLEARGLIRSRDRSGYYVQPQTALPAEPTPTPPTPGRTRVDVSELVFTVLQAAKRREVIPLGSAFPSPHAFPLAKLGRVLGKVAREMEPWRAVEDIAAGNPELRRLIAARANTQGIGVRHEELVISNGAMEALNLCLGVLTRPGDSVLIESPCFYAALQAIERYDLRAVEVRTDPRDGVDLDALEHALRRHRPRACWLMTSFQNPLGCSMSDDKKRALVDLLARHDVPLIEDDVYGELHFGRSRPLPAKAFDRQGLVLHCSSFSKILAPGYRIGWVAAGRYAERVMRAKLTTSLSSPVPNQAALASYLAHGDLDRHLRPLRDDLRAQQARMLQAIVTHFPKGTRATHPDGGYFVWVELPESYDALELHRDALDAGISIAPGPIFSAQRAFRHGVRLNYGYAWTPRMDKAMATLGRLLRRQHEARSGRTA